MPGVTLSLVVRTGRPRGTSCPVLSGPCSQREASGLEIKILVKHGCESSCVRVLLCAAGSCAREICNLSFLKSMYAHLKKRLSSPAEK